MKQEYIRPEVWVTELELQSMLAISIGGTLQIRNNRGQELSIGRESGRGWGDLWVEE